MVKLRKQGVLQSLGKAARAIDRSRLPNVRKQAHKAANTIKKIFSRGKPKPKIKMVRGGKPKRSLLQSRNSLGSSINSTSSVYHNHSHVVDHFALREEKVCNISGNTAGFNIQQNFYLNPGNKALFPIFSAIANTYECWRPKVLRFEYRTEAYKATNTFSAGKIIIATDYNALDPPFTTDSQMENYTNSVKAAPYDSFVHNPLWKDKHGQHDPIKTYYTNYSDNIAAPAGDNEKFYDLGNLQIALMNMAGTTECGELYVVYQFDMIRPRAPITDDTSAQYQHITESPNGTGSSSQIFGTSGPSTNAGSTLNFVATGNNVVLANTGVYLLSLWQVSGTGTFSAAPNFTSAGSNLSEVSLANDETSGQMRTYNGIYANFSMIIQVTAFGTGAANTITFSGGSGGSQTSTDLFINYMGEGTLTKEDPLDTLAKKVADILKSKSSVDIKSIETKQIEIEECETPYHVVDRDNSSLSRISKADIAKLLNSL